jgi:hypothetical protein
MARKPPAHPDTAASVKPVDAPPPADVAPKATPAVAPVTTSVTEKAVLPEPAKPPETKQADETTVAVSSLASALLGPFAGGAPTTLDTLFTLAEADANAKALINNGVDTKVLWFCGGHGACLTSFNNGYLIQQRTLEWLDRYVKGEASVNTGPQFEWVDQHGQYFSSNTYPVKQGTPIDASRTGGTLPLLPLLGGSGPQLGVIGLGPIGALLGLPSGAAATNAINLTIPAANIGRTGAHRQRPDGDGRADAGPGRDGHAATGSVGVPVRNDLDVGRAQCVQHGAVAADRRRRGDIS